MQTAHACDCKAILSVNDIGVFDIHKIRGTNKYVSLKFLPHKREIICQRTLLKIDIYKAK